MFFGPVIMINMVESDEKNPRHYPSLSFDDADKNEVEEIKISLTKNHT